MNLPPYVNDILSQPDALRTALDSYPTGALADIRLRLNGGEFKRLVITGMGGSYTAAYPAYLTLARLGLPVSLAETSELLHFYPEQITADTLLWVVSQSGRSAEVVRLLETPGARAATVIATTNEPDSPLGRAGQVMLPINAGEEYTVSTRTYLNSLVVMSLAAGQLSGQDHTANLDALRQTADAAENYLSLWQDRVQEMKDRIGLPRKLFFLGRGPSMAAAQTGALILKEAAKAVAEGMTTAWFRHGPLELGDHNLTVLVFAGPENVRALNRSLTEDVIRYGGRAFWLSPQRETAIPWLHLPDVPQIGMPVAEMLPLQMLSISLAELNGFVPGEFRHLGKVVLEE